MECPICKENAIITPSKSNPFNADSKIECQQCGDFIVSEDFLKFPETLPPEKIKKISEWLKKNSGVTLRRSDWSKLRHL